MHTSSPVVARLAPEARINARPSVSSASDFVQGIKPPATPPSSFYAFHTLFYRGRPACLRQNDSKRATVPTAETSKNNERKYYHYYDSVEWLWLPGLGFAFGSQAWDPGS